MYIPHLNKITDELESISFMQQYSFATIVSVRDGVPEATHLPFLVQQGGDKIVLRSHFAKANPQAEAILSNNNLVIFMEPHAYISPKHYEKEANVPTWNYVAVHGYGKATLLESVEAKMELLEQTIINYEAEYLNQWNSLPDDFKLKILKGITAFEIVVDDLQAKKKLSQNKTEKERENIINALSHAENSNERNIAEYMRKSD